MRSIKPDHASLREATHAINATSGVARASKQGEVMRRNLKPSKNHKRNKTMAGGGEAGWNHMKEQQLTVYQKAAKRSSVIEYTNNANMAATVGNFNFRAAAARMSAHRLDPAGKETRAQDDVMAFSRPKIKP